MARAANPEAPSGAPVPKMSPDAQRFVVRQYARFRKPSEILVLLKEEYPDLDVSINAISYYNPERDIFPREKWGEFYETERRAYVAGVESVGIAHARERLEYLDLAIRQAVKARNFVLVGQLVETAAKEVGGAYTNRRESQVAMTAAVSVEAEDLLARAEGQPRAPAPVAADVPPVVQSK